ncbi:hypothetical protein BC832DRAFT_482439 [Gaertneriomyces semiglobifer]|nr:hypothetical protein BC832DRAFT_482439 [Gaertneriomyces semiglobifer]
MQWHFSSGMHTNEARDPLGWEEGAFLSNCRWNITDSQEKVSLYCRCEYTHIRRTLVLTYFIFPVLPYPHHSFSSFHQTLQKNDENRDQTIRSIPNKQQNSKENTVCCVYLSPPPSSHSPHHSSQTNTAASPISFSWLPLHCDTSHHVVSEAAFGRGVYVRFRRCEGMYGFVRGLPCVFESHCSFS